MSAKTTQLLSSGEFCKLRYDTTPVKSAFANVSFYANNSKNAKFWVVTFLSQMRDIKNFNVTGFYQTLDPLLIPRPIYSAVPEDG
jgi:hypothetical protein